MYSIHSSHLYFISLILFVDIDITLFCGILYTRLSQNIDKSIKKIINLLQYFLIKKKKHL